MKNREPIDLVGRLAARLDLSAPNPAPTEAPPPTALRVAAAPSVAPSVLPPDSAQPRIVGREPPPRVEPSFEPSFERRSAGVVRPEVSRSDVSRPDIVEAREPTSPVEDAPVLRTETPPQDPNPAPVLETPSADEPVHRDVPAVAAEAPSSADAIDRDTGNGRKIVELNLIRLQKDGFLTPQNQRSLIAEEYRIIKRPLLRAAFDVANDPNHLNHVVMITSARPGEGKTFTAINLAMSVATERDLHVLLVDCDIRRMGLSKTLGVADRKGLMDVLIGPNMSMSDVILRTNIPNLSIIPSGQPIEEATEVFASAKMTQLVDDLARRYPDRFIIFDAPPVLVSSEPGVLAVHVGQTVMVVHANETNKRAIAQSIPLINGCPNVHFVLNRVTLAAGSDRFGYYGTY